MALITRKILIWLVVLLPIVNLVAQPVTSSKSSFGSGATYTSGISIASIVGQPSPVTKIGGGQVQLFQGFLCPIDVGLANERPGSLAVFPNPSDGKISIKLPKRLQTESAILSIKVVDNFGRVVRTIDVTSQEVVTSDLSDLSNGVYHLVLQASSVQKVYAKIIIQ